MAAKSSKKPALTLDAAREQLAADERTHPFDPTVAWYSGPDDRTKRLAALAKTAVASLEADPAWRDVAARALVEVGHTDRGRSALQAVKLLDESPGLDLEGRRVKATALAIAALASNASGSWEKAADGYRDVLAAAPGDPHASYMRAACLRRHVKANVESPKMKKAAPALLDEALRLLSDRDEPLALRERGLVLGLLQRHDESARALAAALPGLESAADLYDLVVDTRLALGRARFAAKDWPGVIAAYGEPTEISPEPTLHLVNAYVGASEPAKALALLERWRAENVPGYDGAILRAGAAAKRALGAHDDAKALLREALQRGETAAAEDARTWYGETL